MDCPSDAHGMTMDSSCKTMGYPRIGKPMRAHGRPTEYVWATYGMPTGYPFAIVGYPWGAHWMLMGFP